MSEVGRRRTPIENTTDPIARFAARLRQRMEQGPAPTYREIAAATNWSRSTVAAAVRGKRLPTWPVTESILKSCGAPDSEIPGWQTYWDVVSRATSRRRPAEPAAEVEWDGEDGPGPPEPVTRDPRDWRPRPDLVDTFADLAHELRRFKVSVGSPSLRVLVRDMEAQMMRPMTSVSTLSDIFTGRHRPNVVVYRTLLTVLLIRSSRYFGREEMQRPWRSEHEWAEAWARAEFNRQLAGHRPARARPGYGVVLPNAREGDRSVISALAVTQPRVAATMLVDMNPKVVSEVISKLPPPASAKILTAVLELHWDRKTDCPPHVSQRVELSTTAGTARRFLHPPESN